MYIALTVTVPTFTRIIEYFDVGVIPAMQIPDNAEVKPFEDADLGNLLIGRMDNEDRNFVAIRTELQVGTGDKSPYMAILSSWVDDQDFPYLCNPAVGVLNVLDLGDGWSFKVKVNEESPAFRFDPQAVLILCGNRFYIRLLERMYLDAKIGAVVDNLGEPNNIAAWVAFDVCLSQPGVDGPGPKIFSWPRE